MAANAKSVNALISLIKAEGVAAADIQTSSLVDFAAVFERELSLVGARRRSSVTMSATW